MNKKSDYMYYDNPSSFIDLEEQNPGDSDLHQHIYGVKNTYGKHIWSPELVRNGSSEEQKNVINSNQNSGNDFKAPIYPNNNSDAPLMRCNNYIWLDSGKIIIKGNEIETLVPWEIKTLNKKVSMLSPQYPVKITITPLMYDHPQTYNSKNQSFMSNKMNQNDEILMSSKSLVNAGSTLQSSNNGLIAQYDILYDAWVNMLNMHYCLDSCNSAGVPLNRSSSRNCSNEQVIPIRSSSQANVQYNCIAKSSNLG
jgi:hypothetical protein